MNPKKDGVQDQFQKMLRRIGFEKDFSLRSKRQTKRTPGAEPPGSPQKDASHPDE
jgi:hypothetical protein